MHLGDSSLPIMDMTRPMWLELRCNCDAAPQLLEVHRQKTCQDLEYSFQLSASGGHVCLGKDDAEKPHLEKSRAACCK